MKRVFLSGTTPAKDYGPLSTNKMDLRSPAEVNGSPHPTLPVPSPELQLVEINLLARASTGQNDKHLIRWK